MTNSIPIEELQKLVDELREEVEYQHGLENHQWAYGVEASADKLEELIGGEATE